MNEQQHHTIPSSSVNDSLMKKRTSSLSPRKNTNSQQFIVKETSVDNADGEDEDRLFLLSLVKEFKKIPEDFKLDAKSDIIDVLKKWQRISNYYDK